MIIDFLEKDKDISNLSNFNTPCKSKYYFEINKLEDLSKLSHIYKFAKDKNLSFLIIWWWTNILFAFDNFNWIIVKNKLLWWTYDKKTGVLESYSNELISDISGTLERDYRQDLWHRFIWLPWTIWWAIFWNAWCFWLETENNFLEWDVLNLESWLQKTLSKKEMRFSYRSSLLKEDWFYFLIRSRFDLSKKVEKYSSNVDNIDFRENKQPKWKTCWSFFKNPSKELTAWFLIEDVWLNWYKIGGAYFSSLHANFLMNDGTWSYKDLIKLINLAQKKVREKYSLDLVPEVRIIK